MTKAVDWDVKQQNKQTKIKGNCECSNMQTHILSLHWGGFKGQNNYFLKVVMLHIKLIGMEHRAHASTYSVIAQILSQGSENVGIYE